MAGEVEGKAARHGKTSMGSARSGKSAGLAPVNLGPAEGPQWYEQLGVFALTYLSYCTLYSTRKPFSVVKADLQELLGFSTPMLGAIETTFLATYAGGQLIIPPVAQRFANPPTILLISYVGSGILAVVFGALSWGIPMLLVWALNGACHAAAYPLLVRTVGPWFSTAARGRALGTWTTSQQIGSALATAFASFAAASLGWRWTFYLPGLLVGLNGFVLFFLLPSGCSKTPEAKEIRRQTELRAALIPEKKAHSAHGGECTHDHHADRISFSDSAAVFSNGEAPAARPLLLEDANGYSSLRDGSVDGDQQMGALTPPIAGRHCSTTSRCSTVRCAMPEGCQDDGKPVTITQVLAIPDLAKVALAFFFVKLVRYALLCWLPFYLVKGLAYDKPTAGYSSIAFDVGGVVGAISTGIVSDQILKGRRLMAASITSALAAIAVCIFITVSGYGFWWMLISMLGVGFFMAGPDSVLGAAAAQDLCDRSAYGVKALVVAAGIVNGLGSSGAAVQGALISHVEPKYGWTAVFVILCAFLAVASGLLVFSLPRENKAIKAKAAAVRSLSRHLSEVSTYGAVGDGSTCASPCSEGPFQKKPQTLAN